MGKTITIAPRVKLDVARPHAIKAVSRVASYLAAGYSDEDAERLARAADILDRARREARTIARIDKRATIASSPDYVVVAPEIATKIASAVAETKAALRPDEKLFSALEERFRFALDTREDKATAGASVSAILGAVRAYKRDGIMRMRGAVLDAIEVTL